MLYEVITRDLRPLQEKETRTSRDRALWCDAHQIRAERSQRSWTHWKPNASSIAPGVDSVAKSVTVTNQIPQALAEPLNENGPLEAVFPDGTKTTIPADRDPREVFADWLIRAET